jgi:hypothetical protein
VDQEWISANAALEYLGGASYDARVRWVDVIVGRARNGLLSCEADAVMLNGQRQEGQSPRVPTEVWSTLNLENNWVAGDFGSSGHPLAKNPGRYEAFGVRLLRSEIERMASPANTDRTVAQVERTAELGRAANEDKAAAVTLLSYRRRTPTREKRRLAVFLKWASNQIDGSSPRFSLTGDKTQLHAIYTDWNNKQNRDAHTTSRVDPLKLTAFKKWLNDWNAGARW